MFRARVGVGAVALIGALAMTAAVPPAFGQRTAPRLTPATAEPVSIVMGGEDLQQATIIGTNGEVFEGNGRGEYIRVRRVTTAARISGAGKAGDAIVAIGEGVVYRLEPNGWSALRVANKTRAVMASGSHAVAAAGSKIVAISRDAHGEAATLATAGSTILALGSGKQIVLATDRGVYRVHGKKCVAIKGAPRRTSGFAGDRWALVDQGVADLRSGRTTAWPADVEVAATAQLPDDRLLAVARVKGGGLVLLAVGGPKLVRTPIPSAAISAIPTSVRPTAVAGDAAGRVAIAFADGHVALGRGNTWTATALMDAPEVAHPGSPPATSP